MDTAHIRSASLTDIEAIARIYAHHVLRGTASFEEEPPGPDSWRRKLETIASCGWPFLVSEFGGEVTGYAYAMQFRDRPAYRFTCENSIYVHPGWVGRGIGYCLLTELLVAAQASGFRQIIAVIGGAEPASVALHRKCGFLEAGRMKAVGFKFDRWLDTLYMQRDLTNAVQAVGKADC